MSNRKELKICGRAGSIRLIVILLLFMVVIMTFVIVEVSCKDREKVESKVEKASMLAKGYYYDEALDLLEKDKGLYDPEDSDDPITKKIAEIRKEKASLVKYTGNVEHVFFHSLIVYPQMAFDDKGGPAAGYNAWMTTVTEFKRMLPLLEKKGYVLYPIQEMCSIDEKTGKVTPKDIYLPSGKKPLIISVDDVDYYDYMKHDGFARRLVIDKDGRIATEVVTPDGKTEVTSDGDVFPILDDYVAKHPEFSWKGYKGIVATTGYQGAFGYRITDGLPQTDKWRGEVRKISETLRADGWDIACHSYTHNGYLQDRDVSLGKMKNDIDRWKKNIEPYVGKTTIYISPYGFQYNDSSPAHRYISQAGFHIFCPVNNSRKLSFYDKMMVSPRFDLDGFKMSQMPEEVNKYYFDVNKVWDKSRPAFDPSSIL